MNATMINNREYVETLFAMESKLNQDLIHKANEFYREKLSPSQEKRLLELSFDDKQWLLEQYKEEMESNVVPDLDNLY